MLSSIFLLNKECFILLTPYTHFDCFVFVPQPRDTFAPGQPDVLQVAGDSQASIPQRWAEPPVRRKESVARMTFGGLALVVAVSNLTHLKHDTPTGMVRVP